MVDIHDRRRYFNEALGALAGRAGRRQETMAWEELFAIRLLHEQDPICDGGRTTGGFGYRTCLALGLTYRTGLRLTLILPKGEEFPTLQRSAWLDRSVQPHVYVHSGGKVIRVAVPNRRDTIEESRSA